MRESATPKTPDRRSSPRVRRARTPSSSPRRTRTSLPCPGSSRAMADSVVDIALIFPELLGTYGDGGNALVLARRLERRGIDNRILEIGIHDPIPRGAAIYLLGGGEDAPQFTALDALRASGALAAAVGEGAVLLAVCAGYQLVGSTLSGPEGTTIDGLGLLDASTTRAPSRLVGEVAVQDEQLDTGWLVGFENHRGITTPGPEATPIGPRTPERGCATDGAVH